MDCNDSGGGTRLSSVAAVRAKPPIASALAASPATFNRVTFSQVALSPVAFSQVAFSQVALSPVTFSQVALSQVTISPAIVGVPVRGRLDRPPGVGARLMAPTPSAIRPGRCRKRPDRTSLRP